MDVNSVKTFSHLYDYLQTNIDTEKEFLDILNKSRKKYGKIEWLESFFRLFSIIGLVEQFNDFIPCYGNFNLGTIRKMDSESYVNFFTKSCKDSGDSSDLTLEHKINKKRIICSVKNRDSHIGELDIDKMNFYSESYVDFEWIYCIVCPNKEELNKMITRSKKTSGKLRKKLEEVSTIFLDYQDMYNCLRKFKHFFGQYNSQYLIEHLDDFLVLKPIMKLRFHQKMSVKRMIDLLNDDKKTILLGQITRSGKSYCMAGLINELIEGAEQKNLHSNVMIISTDPNDTFGEYEYILKTFHQFRNVKVVRMTGKIKENPSLSSHTVFLASKQFLDDKISAANKIKWLSDINFDLAFVDEVHFGGTTQLADKALQTYLKDCPTIYVTATYRKPVNYYNIPKSDWVLWDMEDITLMKNIRNNIEKLKEKHGKYFTECLENMEISIENVEKEYKNEYPSLVILTREINENDKRQIQEYNQESEYGKFGFSCSALMKTNDGKFAIENTTSEHLLTNFLKGIFDESKPLISDTTSLFARIKKYDTRQFTQENCLAILVYLPLGTIKETAIAFQNFMRKHNILPNFNYCDLCNESGNIRTIVNNHRQIARNQGKQGIIILSGNKVRLGITISFCDVVVMLSNAESFDDIFQRFARCCSGDNTNNQPKRYGFVIDPSIERVLKWSIDYSSTIKPQNHIKDSFRYVLETNIFELNYGELEMNEQNIDNIVNDAYKLWVNDLHLDCVKDIVKDLFLKNTFSDEEISRIKSLLSFRITNNKQLTINDNKSKSEIKDGIDRNREITSAQNTTTSLNENDESESDLLKISEVINHIIPLLSIFTLDRAFFTMNETIDFLTENSDRVTLICNQIEVWWGKKVDLVFFNSLMEFINDKFTKIPALQDIFKEIKQLFIHSSKDRQEFSRALDKYLSPTELEIKNNAEIPTPYEVRKIILDFYPSSFWKNPNVNILEESCGKGLFLVDIIDRFMNGLENAIPDEKKRYKHIVNKMLYFSDINETNIFICKMLLQISGDDNDLKPNFNIGNTLELNPNDKWGISGFTSILGNPPYEEMDGSNRKAKNHNLWSKFLEYAEELTLDEGYIAQITPCSWMSPTSKVNYLFSSYFVKNLEVETINDYFRSNNKKVGSKFSCYLIEKRQPTNNELTNVNCLFNKQIYSSKCNLYGRTFFPILLSDKSLSIIDKFYNNNLDKISFNTSSELHNSNKKNVLNDQETNVFKYPIKHTSSKQRWSSVKHSIQNEHKILLNLSGNLNPIYDSGIYGVTQATMFALTNKVVYKDILEKKIYKFVFTICKWSGFNIEEVFKNIPFITSNKTNQQLYKIFKLTPEEIIFLEQIV